MGSGTLESLLNSSRGVMELYKWPGKSYLERAIQHLCPIDLSCDVGDMQLSQPVQLNPQARAFTPRRAAVAAAQRIREIAEKETE